MPLRIASCRRGLVVLALMLGLAGVPAAAAGTPTPPAPSAVPGPGGAAAQLQQARQELAEAEVDKLLLIQELAAACGYRAGL